MVDKPLPPGSESGQERRRFQWLRRLHRNQRGSLLVETLVAILVFGVLATGVLGVVQTSNMSKGRLDVRFTAEIIARNQMEHVFEQAYQLSTGTYDTVATPANYSVTAEALDYNGDPDLQTVRVTVFFNGEETTALETLRANR